MMEKSTFFIEDVIWCMRDIARKKPKSIFDIPFLGKEYIGYATHEQYFYKDYFAYQPDYAAKLYLVAKLMHDNGYRFITADKQI